MSDLRSPLARARGLGAAHDGTHHFWVHRLSALALVPLCLWFVASVVCQIGVSHGEFIAWAGQLHVATALVLTIILTFYHAALGLQTVVEDYVHTPLPRLALLLVVKFSSFTFAVVGVMAVLKIMFEA